MPKDKAPSGIDLHKNERILWFGRRSWNSVLKYIIAGSIVFILSILVTQRVETVSPIPVPAAYFPIAGAIVFLLSIIIATIAVFATEYVVTNRRVSSRYGIVTRKTNETSFEKIQDTQFKQGWAGRLLTYGTVSVRTAGTADTEISFYSVGRPRKVQKMLRILIDRKSREEEIERRIKKFEDHYLKGDISREKLERIKKTLMKRLPSSMKRKRRKSPLLSKSKTRKRKKSSPKSKSSRRTSVVDLEPSGKKSSSKSEDPQQIRIVNHIQNQTSNGGETPSTSVISEEGGDVNDGGDVGNNGHDSEEDVVKKLTKLKRLRKKSLITKKEFREKRRAVLNEF